MKHAGLPESGRNIWKMNFFQVGEKSGILWIAREIYSVQEGKYVLSHEVVLARLPPHSVTGGYS